MRFIKQALRSGEPLLVEPAAAQAAVEAASASGIGDQLAYFFGDKPKPYRVGKVGVVPLSGVIGYGLPAFDKATGGADLVEFRAELAKMAARPDVETIIIHVDSPGGSVIGVQETADMVYNLKKPTVTFADSMMASAGYYIGSQADRVLVAPSAIVGSVGVYTTRYTYDVGRDGYTAELFKDGTLKADGVDGVPLTDEQRAHIQSQVNYIGSQFRQTVLRTRSGVSMADMQGQSFYGSQAAEKGMATGLASSLDELIAELNA